MTPELQKYYEERFSMMATSGWHDLIDDVQKMFDAVNTLAGATVENLEFRKGEVSIMQWLLTLKASSEQAYESLQQEGEPS